MFGNNLFSKTFFIITFLLIIGCVFLQAPVVTGQPIEMNLVNTDNDTLFNVGENGVTIPLGVSSSRGSRKFVIYEPETGRKSAASLFEVDENGVLIPLITENRNFLIRSEAGTSRQEPDTLFKVGQTGVNVLLGEPLPGRLDLNRNFMVGAAGAARGVVDTIFEAGFNGVTINLGSFSGSRLDLNRNFMVGAAGAARGDTEPLFQVGDGGVTVFIDDMGGSRLDLNRNFMVGAAGAARGVADTLLKVGNEGVKIDLGGAGGDRLDLNRSFMVGAAGAARNPFKKIVLVTDKGIAIMADSVYTALTINGTLSISDSLVPDQYGKMYIQEGALYYQYGTNPPINISVPSGMGESFWQQSLSGIYYTEGNVGIGTNQPMATLEVVGTVISNGIEELSDERWKTDINQLTDALNKLMQIRGVNYKWRFDEYPDRNFSEKEQMGLIAQEVEKVIPEVVQTDANGFKSISYTHLTALLVEAIKDQQDQIQELRAENKALKAGQQENNRQIQEIKNQLGLSKSPSEATNR